MQSRSSSRLVSNPSSNPTPSTNPKGRNRRRSKQRIEDFNLDELSPPIVTIADQRTMAQLLQAPTEGYEDAIVVPAITADNFELNPDLARERTPLIDFHLRNEIINFQQRFDESFSEAWDGFKDLLRACPHHGFLELRQLDTFYNALNSKDQDSLNSAAGVEESYVTYGDAHSYRNCPATDGNVYRDNIQEFVSQASAVNYNQGNTSYRPPMIASTSSSGTLPSNTIANPKSELNAITTRSGVSYDGPQIPPLPSFLPKVVENKPEATKSTVTPPKNGSTEDVQPLVVQTETPVIQISKPVTKPVIAPVSAPKPNPKSSIQYPSRRNDERNREKANNQIEKFYQIFKDMSFKISFADALILTHKFSSTLKALIGNKEKLSEMARTPLNEHCSVVLLKKLPEKLGDPGKFLIPCDFPRMDECLALADLGARINLMPCSVWKRLSLPELTLTCMTLELADRSISRPIGVAEDVYVKVGKFHFPADFVVVDFDADPRVPLILRRSFLKTERALIDVLEGELTLRIGKEAITFYLDQTSRYSANYNDMTKNRIDVIDIDYEEYSQEVLGFSDVIASGNPTPNYDLIVSTTSLTLTPFGNSDFLLEEVDAFLALEDDPTTPKVDQSNSFQSCLSHLEKMLKRCEDTNLCLNWEKSHFMVKEGIVFGHKISKEGIEVDKAKVDVITKLHHPTTVKGIRSFLGHAGFYRRFIKDFSKIARPMTRLLKKDTPFYFSKECVEAFQTLKRKLTKAPILIALDWDMPFELMCDASDFAIGAVLGQRQDKYLWPIHYASKTMTEAKSNYTTTEKEMLAVVYALEKFWSYLIMNKSIVYSDHFALKYLFAKKYSKARLLRTVELAQPDGPNFKVNGHCLKHYFGEEIFPDLKTHAKGFCPPVFTSSASFGNHVSKSNRTNVYLLAYRINGLRFT
nr:reverse transcriptase domain-containing protein [Tanacetum cinerariifolium]